VRLPNVFSNFLDFSLILFLVLIEILSFFLQSFMSSMLAKENPKFVHNQRGVESLI